MREVLNVTYAHLSEGRTQEQQEELDAVLTNPAMSPEEMAARRNAAQFKKAGMSMTDGPRPKPLRPRGVRKVEE